MKLALGIDTGGTYTDAVLVDQSSSNVLVTVKALTTHTDLSIGIGQAIEGLFDGDRRMPGCSPADVELVSLSTTLATNALAEGQGGAVCLLLIGYDPEMIRRYGFQRDLPTEDVVFVQGGHDESGDEVMPFDETAAREAILSRIGKVEAFAISGYFGVRNPEHELRARALVADLTGLPVTCGHELTSRLNAIQRATTVALNAHLILPLRELIMSVRRKLDAFGIGAELMVVKGDGSLVRAEWALERPIETILSGPAASVVGARRLSGRDDIWAVDVGGTTTDIARLRHGWPTTNPKGASVGGWRTMVEAIDVHTSGLGGDSHVRLGSDGLLVIGPRRVVPLCRLASDHPQLCDELQHQIDVLHQVKEGEPRPRLAGPAEFLIRGRTPPIQLEAEAQVLWEELGQSPLSIDSLVRMRKNGQWMERRIERLEAQRLVQRIGFTPTDALHVLGRYNQWKTYASQLGAELLGELMGLSADAFCELVVRRMSERLATELLSKVLEDRTGLPDWERELSAAMLLDMGLGRAEDSDLECRFTLRQPIVAIGAPVEAYMPDASALLHTKLIVPPNAAVANAVGAVAGSVVQRVHVLIRPLESGNGFRLHLLDGVRDFDTVEQAVAHAQEKLTLDVESLARRAGAAQTATQMSRQDHLGQTSRGKDVVVYLGTELEFIAIGRPSLNGATSLYGG